MNKKSFIFIISLILLAIAFTGSTYCFFIAQDNVPGISMKAMSLSDAFQLTSGKAKQETTLDTKPQEAEAQPVASFKNGELSLNFGEIPVGNEKKFIEVFLLQNVWERKKPLQITYELSDSLYAVSNNQKIPVLNLDFKQSNPLGSITLDYLSVAQVDAKVNKTPAGTYEGSITIRALNGFLKLDIPTKIVVK